MAKVRVHELAKELGQDSKTLLAKLTELGEFVKSASSTIELPVQRKLREAFAESAKGKDSVTAVRPTKPAPAPKPGKPAAPKAVSSEPVDEAPAKETQAPALGSSADAPASKPAPAAKADESAEKTAPKPGARPAVKNEEPAEAAATAESDTTESSTNGGSSSDDSAGAIPRPPSARPGPRPGNNPFASAQGMPRPGGPRPGNNPFAAAQGMPRPGGSNNRGNRGQQSAQGGTGTDRRPPRQGENAEAPRSRGPRPTPGMMPGRSATARPGAPAPGGAGAGAGAGGRGRGRGPRPGGPSSGPGTGGPTGGGPTFAGRGGRGAGRGSTQGAFGRQGGKSSKSRKSKRAKRQEFEQQTAPAIGGVQVPRGDGSTEIRIRAGGTLADFADRIGVNPASLVTVLFHLGEMATATQSLDEETFQALGAELGYVVKLVSPEEEDRELLESFDIDLAAEEAGESAEDLEPRSPVVTVMGHVDHGKTALLDAIRRTDVAGGEAGGITQHIGAYQVHHATEENDRTITFIDTPGHEAFTAMRARGAEVTDIAILVVAADDGVMPQTIEALNHAQAANVPIVVAVNKIDKPEANPDKIRAQLTEYNLVAEEYGGETMFVEVSAKQRQGIDDLLEAVLLTADAALELQANPNKDARGVAIEANLDRGRGAMVTGLVQSGTLRIGDSLVAGTAHGRVRAMFDEKGHSVHEAGPSRPVQILGLTSVPRAGDSFLVAPDDRTARQIADKREAAERAATLAKRRKRVSLEDFTQALQEGKVETLNLVLKGDVSGAVEALEDALLQIDVGEDVALRIIHRGVGEITQNDVNLATVDNAVIIGFNVRASGRVAEMADREGVDIKHYTVIYSAIDDVEAALKGMLKPEFEEVQLGSAEVRQVFKSSKFGNIAGSIVRSGTIRRNTKARLLRDGEVIAPDVSIESLRREKDDVTEVREGYECGIGLGVRDVQEGDIVETYEMREKPRA